MQSKVSSAEVNLALQRVYRSVRLLLSVEQPTTKIYLSSTSQPDKMQRESQHVTNLQSHADGINTNFELDTTGESFIGDISINSEPSDPTWEPDAVQIYSTRDGCGRDLLA